MQLARKALIVAAVTAAVLACTLNIAQADTQPCAGFRWGDGGTGLGECWTRNEGRAFATWLGSRGASPKLFAVRHPELAATFTKPWPPVKPKATWQTCANGYACAKAVIQHYFGAGWRYPLAIVGCETGHTFSKYVRGSAGEVSWWQLHPVHFGWIDEARAVADPRYATRIAYRMSHGGSDWSPWTCARYV